MAFFSHNISNVTVGFGDWPAWIGLIISIAALVVAIMAAKYSFQQVKEAREANRLQRAELEIQRKQYDLQKSEGEKPTRLPYVPPWRLEHVSRSEYALTNGGTDTEHDVRVEEDGTIINPTKLGDIRAKDSVPLKIVFTMASPSRSVHVSWRHGDEKNRRTLTLPVSAG